MEKPDPNALKTRAVITTLIGFTLHHHRRRHRHRQRYRSHAIAVTAHKFHC